MMASGANVVFMLTEQPRDLDAYESIYVPQLNRFFYVRAAIAGDNGSMLLPGERVMGAVYEPAPAAALPFAVPPFNEAWGEMVVAALASSPATAGELAAVMNVSSRRMNAYLQYLKALDRVRLTDRSVSGAKLWEAVQCRT